MPPPRLSHIPQVVPARTHTEHLDGAFDSAEHTVRLFASLCLARTHPEVTTWADAATALGLPADLGAPTARACSATMRVDNHEWATRIHRAWHDLHRRDYRAAEDHVRALTVRPDWFETWARAHRPGTRHASRGLAVTWLWIHHAHAHPDTSPAWHGQRPAPERRAAYRHFEASLTREQQQALRQVLE